MGSSNTTEDNSTTTLTPRTKEARFILNIIQNVQRHPAKDPRGCDDRVAAARGQRWSQEVDADGVQTRQGCDHVWGVCDTL